MHYCKTSTARNLKHYVVKLKIMLDPWNRVVVDFLFHFKATSVASPVCPTVQATTLSWCVIVMPLFLLFENIACFTVNIA